MSEKKTFEQLHIDPIQQQMLAQVAELHEVPEGAYSLRVNGASAAVGSSEHVTIVKKEDKPGIDIYVAPGTKHESIHIPVVLSQTGLKDLVYNDFHIGEGADVVIIAGCGIHNCGVQDSAHDGIHSFFLEKNARVKYVERHYGEGDGRGGVLMNPTTIVELAEGSYMEMDTSQIKGIDSTVRVTRGTLAENATLIIKEKIMTHGEQYAETNFSVELNGKGSSTDVVSRSVARDQSKQKFLACISGNTACHGHSACDAIIMDQASVQAIPELAANDVEASLIHEAAIGKIAGDQLIKLMTLGLSEEEAEAQIINGFLK